MPSPGTAAGAKKFGAVSALNAAAMATKVRAMYGRLLKPAEFAALNEKHGIAEIWAYLSETPSWGSVFKEAAMPAVSGSPAASVSAAIHAALSLLSASLRAEALKLYRFGGSIDRTVLSLCILRAQRRAARFALTRICSGGYFDPADRSYLEPLSEKSRVDIGLIAASATFDDLLKNLENTIYRDALSAVPLSENNLPLFPPADHALESRFYSVLYAELLGSFSAGKMRLLAEHVGLEADLLNISGIIRLHRHFPVSLKKYADLLIPVHGSLTKELTSALASAQNEAAAIELLRGTRWAKYFPEGETADLETISETAMESFCRGVIRGSGTGPQLAPIYLTLRELEIKKLSRIIAAAKYN